jgi:hypothetical protein
LVIYFLYNNYQISKNIPPLKKYISKINGSKSNLIQIDAQCAKYDDSLFYTLRPGQCNYKNLEFDTSYQINSQGLRDDDKSLDKPEIIVLGDSYAMGWGVEQDETFASLVEKSTGLKTLNTAISSYGTARQYLMLKRQDLSNLKYIIIQYCANDHSENRVFTEAGNKLAITKESQYLKLVTKQEKKLKKRRPFRMSSIVIRELVRDIKKSMGTKNSNPITLEKVSSKEEFDDLSIIINQIQELTNRGVEIILFEAHIGYDNLDSEIFNYYESNKMLNLKVFDSKEILNKEDYFIIDAHYNSSGHQKIANRITNIIKGNK